MALSVAWGIEGGCSDFSPVLPMLFTLLPMRCMIFPAAYSPERWLASTATALASRFRDTSEEVKFSPWLRSHLAPNDEVRCDVLARILQGLLTFAACGQQLQEMDARRNPPEFSFTRGPRTNRGGPESCIKELCNSIQPSRRSHRYSKSCLQRILRLFEPR